MKTAQWFGLKDGRIKEEGLIKREEHGRPQSGERGIDLGSVCLFDCQQLSQKSTIQNSKLNVRR